MSINIDEDYIDIFLLYNNKKLKSNNPELTNYYRIITKDIGVKDEFTDINCNIVNDIDLTISIKFKNKFSTQGRSFKDILNSFNQPKQAQKKANENQYVPKKLKMPNFLSKSVAVKKTEEPKKIEEPKEEEIQKNEEQDKKEEIQKNEEIDIKEEPEQVEEQKINEEKTENEPENKDEEVNNNADNENKEIETPKETKTKDNNISNEEPKKNQQKSKEAPTPTPTPNPKMEKSNTFELDKKENSFEKNYTFSVPSTREKAKEKKKTTPTIEEEDDDDFVVLDIDDLNEANSKNTQIFLQPKKYSDYLNEQKQKGIKHPYRETFCEGFFISSFPQKDGKVIEMSTSFPAQCTHEACSKLPAMKPEIIFRYPLQDTKTLELNNLAATICFPTGIKVCYDENGPKKIIKDYVTSITNQKGERYYMMNYHFYLKYPNDDYHKQFTETPLKYNLRKFGDAFIGLSEEELTEDIINVIQENLEFSQELGFRDYVFVPYCLCLISKYPYVQEMEKCLRCIYTIISKGDSNIVINDLIMYLINSIPIPAKNTKIKFLLPYNNNCIDIDCPKLEDINIMNLSATSLLKYFSNDNLVIIFRLLISEKKILLIDNNYERLSTVADGLVSILYPFQWIHTYIPIMSDQMLKYLETFLPFLNGINESLMHLVEKVFQEGEVEESDEVFLIYIKENRIKLSSTLKGDNKKFEKYIQDNIPSLPSGLEKELKNKLKRARNELELMDKNKINNTNRNKQNCELQIRDAFIDLFVEMFQDYAKYLSFIEQDPVFNKSLFLEKKPNNEKKFYNEILDTQLFQQFTQNVVNEDVNYFNNKITLHELGKRAKQEKNIKIEKEYCINPEFLHLTKNNEIPNINTLLKECKEKYPDVGDKQLSLISENLIKIDEKKYNEKNCQVYFTPEELETEKAPVPLVEIESETRNPRKMTNSGILQKLKAMNLKASSTVKKKEGLSEKEKDNIKESIKDYVIKIFKSEDVNLDAKEKTDLLNKLNMPFGREFFISLLSKNSSNIILLKDNAFNLLWYLIYMPLINTLKLEETDKLLEDIVLLIKCSTYFGIQEEGQTKTLFDKNIEKIKDFSKIQQKNFWEKWYEIELKKNEKSKDDVKFKQSIIYEICQTLIKLQLPKSMVRNLSDNINVKEFGKGSEIQHKTFKEIVKYITAAKYISQAI